MHMNANLIATFCIYRNFPNLIRHEYNTPDLYKCRSIHIPEYNMHPDFENIYALFFVSNFRKKHFCEIFLPNIGKKTCLMGLQAWLALFLFMMTRYRLLF